MNRVATSRIATCVVAAALGCTALVYAQQNNSQVFRGQISDSQCAMNVHSLTRSHQEMLKSKSMGGTPTTCSQYCIEHLGGELVLSSGKDVYKLDRPDLVHGFEGKKVKITGVLQQKPPRLHVLKIELQHPDEGK